MTLDESWFYFNTDRERIWHAPEETPFDKERHMIQSPKSILIVVGSITGFHMVKLLPKGNTFSVCYSIDEIVSEIASWREVQQGTRNDERAIEN
jgi:hypothetical protein